MNNDLANLISTRGAGVKVYRVVDHVAAPDQDYTWIVEAREIKLVDKRGVITLVRSFTNLAGKQYRPDTLGRLIFLTREEAIRDFARRARESIEAAERQKTRANEALSWALNELIEEAP